MGVCDQSFPRINRLSSGVSACGPRDTDGSRTSLSTELIGACAENMADTTRRRTAPYGIPPQTRARHANAADKEKFHFRDVLDREAAGISTAGWTPRAIRSSSCSRRAWPVELGLVCMYQLCASSGKETWRRCPLPETDVRSGSEADLKKLGGLRLLRTNCTNVNSGSVREDHSRAHTPVHCNPGARAKAVSV